MYVLYCVYINKENKGMEIMFAPVLIPTLNRKDHFQRCIESLARNIGAEYTDIYVSVDFPPNEKYESGYHDICSFLIECRALRGFRSVNIYYQTENLGAWGNIEFLLRKVREEHECYIFSEDDNEFSEYFLEYINNGLFAFNDNPKVISVNGFKDTDWLFNGNTVTGAKLFPAYGYGSWFAKEDSLWTEARKYLLDSKNWRLTNMLKLYMKNKYIFASYIHNILCTDKGLFWNSDGTLRMIDTTKSIYMYFSDLYCIVPEKTKVRNWGNDGSGINMPANVKIDPVRQWPIEDDAPISYDPKLIVYNDENDEPAEIYLKGVIRNRTVLSSIIKYFLLLMCGYDRDEFLRIKGKAFFR